MTIGNRHDLISLSSTSRIRSTGIGRNQNDFAKRQRTMKKKAKAEAKLARRNERKQENNTHDLMEDQKSGESNSTGELGPTTERENGNTH